MSQPDARPLLTDFPAEPGEEDTLAREVVDVTAKMAPGGRFAWDAPAGEWEILRFGYTCTGARVSTFSDGWDGLAIDYLDRTALETYWRDVVAPLIQDAGPQAGKALKYLMTDSWELGGINWTPRFRQQFLQRRGYDIMPWLPVYAGRLVESRDSSNRFLNDLRRTVADVVADEHYRVFAAMAAKHSLGVHPESGGPHGAPIDALETLGVSAFPQTEYWAPSATHRVRDEERFFLKEAASAAHTYGKTLVAAEGMTSIGPQWEETPASLRPAFDQAVTEGMNRLVWLTFTSSPKEMGLPGQEYFAGTHLNPNVTWWPQAGPFVAYLNRVQYLMQQGRAVADVVYYYGDHVPNFVQLKASDPAKVLPGYDYDVVDESVLTHRLAARAGGLALPDGTSYRLLVLPERPLLSPAAARAIRKLVEDGASLLGPRPERATGLEGDREVRAVAAEVWGGCGQNGVHSHRFGKGTVYCGETARQVLTELRTPPDFEGAGLDYAHRQADGAEIYFVRNTRAEAVSEEVTLRVSDLAPEEWDAVRGTTARLAVYRSTADGRTRVPVHLAARGSTILVLRQKAGAHLVETSWQGPEPRVSLAADGAAEIEARAAGRYSAKLADGRTLAAELGPGPQPIEVNGPWTVTFPPGWGAPARATFARLISWPESPDQGIRYYSGTATYTARFELPAESGGPLAWDLDLGEVREIAAVRLNGQDLGILWEKPFRVRLGAAARPGANTLEVDVTNLWPNRLIGDAGRPAQQRLTKTNITKWKAGMPLLPSGLLGPVKVEASRTARLR